MILAFSIFIFLIVIFSILALIFTNTNTNSTTISDTTTDTTTDTTISDTTTDTTTTNTVSDTISDTVDTTTEPSIYNDYVQNPNYNIINIEYQIVGTLSSTTNEPETIILPLYGKQIKSYRWKYYTIVNNLKLDIQKNNDSCMKECEILSNDDIVKIPAYNQTTFKVYLYEYRPPF